MCVMRVSGKNFNIDDFIKATKFEPIAIFKKGEPRFKTKPDSIKHAESGVNILVSNADFNNLDNQIEDSIEFLKKNENPLGLYKHFNDAITLDFGINRKDVAVQSDTFPPELLRLAGNLGISIQISQYDTEIFDKVVRDGPKEVK